MLWVCLCPGFNVDLDTDGWIHHGLSCRWFCLCPGFKVDLDVDGQNNTFVVREIKAGTYAEALASTGLSGGLPAWFRSEPMDVVR
jgi:hypothetical protein